MRDECPHCQELVQASEHYVMQCIANLKQQRDEALENQAVAERANAMHIEALETCRLERDEARAVARDLLFDPYGDTDEERCWHYGDQYDWLQEQPTVDEKGEGAVP